MVTAVNKRRDKDVMKLLVSEYDVHLVNENSNAEFIVNFQGPKDSHYEGVSTNFTILLSPDISKLLIFKDAKNVGK
jgi:ubiquitin-conjugating enzyme E2 H